jgi:MarR family 2-MHQ and catechol resistance regulon transcriptional repressor
MAKDAAADAGPARNAPAHDAAADAGLGDAMAANAVVQGDAALAHDTLAVHAALRRLLRVYQFRDRDRICCHDVSVSQYHALEHVTEVGPVSQNEVAEALYLDKSTLSRVVGALERKGYLARSADPSDRRALRLVATPRGEALVEAVEADLLAREARILAPFPAQVRQAMAQLLETLARAQGDHTRTGGGVCCTLD